MSKNVFCQLFDNEKKIPTTFINNIEEIDGIRSTYSVFSNGLFEIENVPYIGKYTTKKSSFNIPDLDVLDENFTFFNFKKIPERLFDETISFFKEVMKRFSGSEVTVLYYFDTETSSYKVIVPVQKVGKAFSNFIYPTLPSSYVPILEIHSHNTMNAFFSAGDDKDEMKAMLYGVAGNLDRENFSFVFRAKKGNFSKILDFKDLFEKCSSSTPLEYFKEDDFNNIELQKFYLYSDKKYLNLDNKYYKLENKYLPNSNKNTDYPYDNSLFYNYEELDYSLYSFSNNKKTDFDFIYELYEEDPSCFITLKILISEFLKNSEKTPEKLKNFIESLDFSEEEYFKFFSSFEDTDL